MGFFQRPEAPARTLASRSAQRNKGDELIARLGEAPHSALRGEPEAASPKHLKLRRARRAVGGAFHPWESRKTARSFCVLARRSWAVLSPDRGRGIRCRAAGAAGREMLQNAAQRID